MVLTFLQEYFHLTDDDEWDIETGGPQVQVLADFHIGQPRDESYPSYVA